MDKGPLSGGSTVRKVESTKRKTVQIQVNGMSCASCVTKIEGHIKKRPGKDAIKIVECDQLKDTQVKILEAVH